jgi:hypothetical protein
VRQEGRGERDVRRVVRVDLLLYEREVDLGRAGEVEAALDAGVEDDAVEGRVILDDAVGTRSADQYRLPSSCLGGASIALEEARGVTETNESFSHSPFSPRLDPVQVRNVELRYGYLVGTVLRNKIIESLLAASHRNNKTTVLNHALGHSYS